MILHILYKTYPQPPPHTHTKELGFRKICKIKSVYVYLKTALLSPTHDFFFLANPCLEMSRSFTLKNEKKMLCIKTYTWEYLKNKLSYLNTLCTIHAIYHNDEFKKEVLIKGNF